jgi:hypothetical protein
LPVFMAGFSPLLIFIASFLIKKAHWKPSTFDYACGALSSLALILCYLTKDPSNDSLCNSQRWTSLRSHPIGVQG